MVNRKPLRICRSRSEIVAEILGNALKEISGYHLRRASTLTYAQFTGYADMLIQRGLLEQTPNHSWYRTTIKGRNYLESYSAVQRLMNSAEVADSSSCNSSEAILFP